MGRATAHVLVVAAALMAGVARADAAHVRVRLAYEAPNECAGQADFSQRLVQGAPEVELDPLAADVVDVHIARDAGRYRGSVRLDHDGDRYVRATSTATCDELVRALVIFVALGLAPQRHEEPTTEAAPQEPPPPPATAPPAADRREEPPAPLAPRPEPTVSWRLYTGLGASSAIAPKVAGLFSVGAEIIWPTRWAPSVRLLANGAAAPPTAYDADRSIDFALVWARLEGCPIRIPLGGRAVVAPCALVDGGVEVAWLTGARGTSDASAWTAAGGELRAFVPTTRRVGMEATLGALFPFAPLRYSTAKGPYFTTPWVGFFFALGVSLPLS
jgi:hypothetical protein